MIGQVSWSRNTVTKRNKKTKVKVTKDQIRNNKRRKTNETNKTGRKRSKNLSLKSITKLYRRRKYHIRKSRYVKRE